MKTYNKMWKRITALCLTLLMAVTILPAVPAQAATKKMTLYAGESVYFTDYSDVSKVSSSNKKVLAVAKDKDYPTHANMTAKKAGKSNITVKTKKGTSKYTVTVKKADFKIKVSQIAGSQILLSVKNNTGQTFDYANVTYTLKNAAGEVVEKDTKLVDDLVAGKTVYESFLYTSKEELDLTKCSAKVTALSRSLSATYKECASKVKVTDSADTSTKPGYVTFNLKLQNKSKQNVEGAVYVLLYDADDQLIGVRTYYTYLKAGAVKTDSVSADIQYTYTNYDHYKVVKTLFTKQF